MSSPSATTTRASASDTARRSAAIASAWPRACSSVRVDSARASFLASVRICAVSRCASARSAAHSASAAVRAASRISVAAASAAASSSRAVDSRTPQCRDSPPPGSLRRLLALLAHRASRIRTFPPRSVHPIPSVGSPTSKILWGSSREDSTDRFRFPGPGRARLRPSYRCGRRTGSTCRVVGRGHLRPLRRAGAGAGRWSRSPRRRPGRAGRHGHAERGAPADVVLGSEWLRPRARTDQFPPQCRRGGVHRRALRRNGAARRSRARRRTPRRPGQAPLRDRCRHRCGAARVRHRTGTVARTQRGRDRHHQLHERYHRASQGRADHAPQRVDQRRDLRVAHRRQRPRRVSPHAPDVPLQRLGHDVRGHRDGWEAHRAAQGRRRRDPPARRTARSDADVRRARRRGRGARRSRNVGRPDPRQGSRPHRPRRRAAAHAHDRTHRVGARVGVLADLRAHGDVTVAHDEPSPSGVRRSRPDRARPAARSCGRARPSA